MKFLHIIAITVLTLASYQAQAWEYRTRTDQMRGTTTRFAEATSTNKVNFGAPYAGGSTLDLTVRDSPSAKVSSNAAAGANSLPASTMVRSSPSLQRVPLAAAWTPFL